MGYGEMLEKILNSCWDLQPILIERHMGVDSTNATLRNAHSILASTIGGWGSLWSTCGSICVPNAPINFINLWRVKRRLNILLRIIGYNILVTVRKDNSPSCRVVGKNWGWTRDDRNWMNKQTNKQTHCYWTNLLHDLFCYGIMLHVWYRY